jgi:hypothetical protein
MEFALQPFHRAQSSIVERTPYVCKERYDGSPWASYPARKGRVGLSLIDGVMFNPLEVEVSMRLNLISLEEQQNLIQNWLYFGLIAEFLGANSADSQDGSSPLPPNLADSKETLDMIYDKVLLQEGDKTYVRLDEDGLQSFRECVWSTMPQDVATEKARWHHLDRCLTHVQATFAVLPKDFNHAIRFSIASLGEYFSWFVSNGLLRLNDPIKPVRLWTDRYYNNEIKLLMRDCGWCPSDITRCEARFYSFQSLHVLQMMDKSLPKRDHGKCGEYSCTVYQIDIENYHVGHREDGYHCGEELAVDTEELSRILLKGDDKIALLRLEGNLHDMRAELVESTTRSKYIAISHVWADVLGNHGGNSLHRCKLLHLRELVTAVANEANFDQDSENKMTPLIWLDTLCCPAVDGEAKRKGIEKLLKHINKQNTPLCSMLSLCHMLQSPKNSQNRG